MCVHGLCVQAEGRPFRRTIERNQRILAGMTLDFVLARLMLELNQPPTDGCLEHWTPWIDGFSPPVFRMRDKAAWLAFAKSWYAHSRHEQMEAVHFLTDLGLPQDKALRIMRLQCHDPLLKNIALLLPRHVRTKREIVLNPRDLPSCRFICQKNYPWRAWRWYMSPELFRALASLFGDHILAFRQIEQRRVERQQFHYVMVVADE